MSKKTINSIVILSAAVVLFAGASVYQYCRANDYKNQIATSYRRTFTDLADYVDGVDNTLTKAMLVKTPAQVASVSAELWRKASFAQACIGQLPTTEIQLDTVNRFLSQVGDYAYVLSKKVMEGESVSEEEYSTMKTLAGYAVKLNSTIREMESDLYSGKIEFSEEERESEDFYGTREAAVSDGLTQGEEEFADYPTLIYDGPFSDHLENPEIRMLKGKEEISKQEAKQIAIDFFGRDNIAAAEVRSEYGDKIKMYSVRVTKKGSTSEVNIDITKRGGYVMQMTDSRIPQQSDISADDAVKKAKAFLKDLNIIEMNHTYYQSAGNSIIVNLAYEQDGIMVYPDLIKVEVALDNGEIIGYEASGFIQNHIMRSVPENILPQEQITAGINSDIEVEKISKAIIPLDTGREVFCYEVKGRFMEKDVLLYVNAETGEEENALILLHTQGGTLTV